MIRLENGVYICHINGYILKVVYVGKNECKIYLGDEFQGTAPFDYVKKKLNLLEKRWNTAKLRHYKFREFHPSLDYTI
ncbi:hypothetical protein KUV80_11085 [Fictibacillus nanhaiensis]|uniref:hypothetical protein n=1 Tax=Fictibacillus nanhaiensis TaxID=742169 RepID=UPI001C9376E1|nr:hypothetical protein [Fictibacillus nanhaiensis]MBY6037203.1 hypothetical protein [Fictibacillus nanhaiensis]